MFVPGFNIFWLIVLGFICSIVLLIGIYPYHPDSLIGWVVLYLISLPIILFFQVFGEKLLGNEKIKKVSRSGRIIYGVVVIGILVILSMTVINWLEPYLSKWGS